MKLRKNCLPRWNACGPTAQSAWKWENSDTRSIWSAGVRAPTLKTTCDCWDKPQNASLGQSLGNNRSTNPASNELLWIPSGLKKESRYFETCKTTGCFLFRGEKLRSGPLSSSRSSLEVSSEVLSRHPQKMVAMAPKPLSPLNP